MQQPILSLNHHCESNSRIFCFQIPINCPICLQTLDQNEIQVRTLPNPLKPATQGRCSVAIRPTKGNFLTDYHNSSDLHICLITSDGRIAEFDTNGARMNDDINQWKSSLIIRMFDQLSWQLCRSWDEQLEQFTQQDRWHSTKYDEQKNNCFDFVLQFLRSLNIELLEPWIESKTKFCEHFIVPRTKLLARYISLFRKLQAEQLVMLRVEEQ
ncbi:hypothetical protein RDWZM_004409 [Blomia tropicalis]|uniref:MKRN2 opposite strand protein-like C-terminal domain-containing protein n=1 Tax=Blomia tropicalis TaxID=40697 RepID=A0A9Q0RTH3_BLOTA|nr:protein of unknown function (DUF4796) [Blomia tropicalis]KAJ6225864.1 hypothetical protein RDWZM_004409 [Blomia tropicalis]